MTDVTTIKNKWKAVVEAALGNHPDYDFQKVNRSWLLSDEHVKVSPKEGGTVELEIKYPDMGEDSEHIQMLVPQKIAAELQDQGIDASRIQVNTRSYKDYSWMCYSGALKVVLPLDEDTAVLLEKTAKSVGNQNPALFQAQQELVEAIKKVRQDPRVTPEQFDRWIADLPLRLTQAVAKEQSR